VIWSRHFDEPIMLPDGGERCPRPALASKQLVQMDQLLSAKMDDET
jgi:hypothetical protein